MEKHEEMMRALAKELDGRFNGEAEEAASEERTNFVLLVFPNKTGRYTVEVVSNAGDGEDVADMLRNVVAGFDAAKNPALDKVEGHG